MLCHFRIALALVLTVGCASEGPLPPSFDPEAPYTSYRATGGWVTGHLDGRPFTSVEVEASGSPYQRFPDCATQTFSFSLYAFDERGREIQVYGRIRFFEEDGLGRHSPVIVGDDWTGPLRYEDPPEGGALLHFRVRWVQQDLEGGYGVVVHDLRFVDVCDASTGACHVRLEIEGIFGFGGVNDRFGERRWSTLSIGIDLERTTITPGPYGGPTLVSTGACSPPSEADLRGD